MIKVTMKHIRQVNFCSRGTKAWFANRGFSWEDFLNNGIDIDIFEATGDPLALRVAKIARNEDGRG